jgi:multiple sugar transport system permease protein
MKAVPTPVVEPVVEQESTPSPASPGFRRGNRRQANRPALGWQILTVGLLTTLAVYFLLPVYWLAVASTKSPGDLTDSFGLWFKNPEPFTAVRNVLTYNDGIYLRWTFNSILYAGVGAAVATLLAAMAGYALAKYEFRGRTVVFNFILAGVLIPSTMLTVPLFLLFSKVGLTDTYLAVLIPSVVSPFGVYLTRIYAESAIPNELIEAARIAGARAVRIFYPLSLRIMTPALVSVFLFQFVGIWNNFFLPLIMLTDENLHPVTLGIYNWTADYRHPEIAHLAIAGSFLSVVPLMIAIVVMQRFWRGGLTQGSLKG